MLSMSTLKPRAKIFFRSSRACAGARLGSGDAALSPVKQAVNRKGSEGGVFRRVDARATWGSPQNLLGTPAA